MTLKTDPRFETVFNEYPISVRAKMDTLRTLVIETAKNIDGLNTLEETLKWGEPSFVTKNGSTLRINWSPKSPEKYAMYFQCTSKLVSTFRLVYKNMLTFEGNRAIIFKIDEKPPKEILKSCIKATLNYHKVKHLPTLDI